MPIPLSKVPTAESLCNDLGYLKGQGPRGKHALTKSTRAWRDGYFEKYGIVGLEVVDWGSKQGNHEIWLMAKRFLEKGYGIQHWPPGNGSLEYPRDKER